MTSELESGKVTRLVGSFQMVDVGVLDAVDVALPADVFSRMHWLVPSDGPHDDDVCVRLCRLHDLRIQFDESSTSVPYTGYLPTVLALQASSGALVDVLEFQPDPSTYVYRGSARTRPVGCRLACRVPPALFLFFSNWISKREFCSTPCRRLCVAGCVRTGTPR